MKRWEKKAQSTRIHGLQTGHDVISLLQRYNTMRHTRGQGVPQSASVTAGSITSPPVCCGGKNVIDTRQQASSHSLQDGGWRTNFPKASWSPTPPHNSPPGTGKFLKGNEYPTASSFDTWPRCCQDCKGQASILHGQFAHFKTCIRILSYVANSL